MTPSALRPRPRATSSSRASSTTASTSPTTARSAFERTLERARLRLRRPVPDPLAAADALRRRLRLDVEDARGVQARRPRAARSASRTSRSTHLDRLAAECRHRAGRQPDRAAPVLPATARSSAYGKAHGIATEAWAPIAQGKVLDDPGCRRSPSGLGRSTAQVVLRWHIQHGNIVFPKSVTPERIRENFAIFDFELDAERRRGDRRARPGRGRPRRPAPELVRLRAQVAVDELVAELPAAVEALAQRTERRQPRIERPRTDPASRRTPFPSAGAQPKGASAASMRGSTSSTPSPSGFHVKWKAMLSRSERAQPQCVSGDRANLGDEEQRAIDRGERAQRPQRGDAVARARRRTPTAARRPRSERTRGGSAAAARPRGPGRRVAPSCAADRRPEPDGAAPLRPARRRRRLRAQPFVDFTHAWPAVSPPRS